MDQDGNEVAGIRLPPVEAPIATTTGWALRRAGFGANEGCEANGQHIAFKPTKAERLAAGDPRLSLEERYGTHDGYVTAVVRAAEKLEQQRLLLRADVQGTSIRHAPVRCCGKSSRGSTPPVPSLVFSLRPSVPSTSVVLSVRVKELFVPNA